MLIPSASTVVAALPGRSHHPGPGLLGNRVRSRRTGVKRRRVVLVEPAGAQLVTAGPGLGVGVGVLSQGAEELADPWVLDAVHCELVTP